MAVKELFYGIFLCFVLVGLTGFSPLGNIRLNEPIDNGQELGMHVNLNNDLAEDFDNVKVRAYMLDWYDEPLYNNNIELNEGEKASSWLFWDVPADMPAGDYLVRVVASGDGFRDVDYTWVSVY